MPQNEQENIEEIENSKPYKLTVRVYTTKAGTEFILEPGKPIDIQGKNQAEPYLQLLLTGENELAIIINPLKFNSQKES